MGITAGDGDIFVSTMSEGISRIDPATNEARAVVDLEGWIYGLAYGDGEMWATNTEDGVYRLDDTLLDPDEE